MMHTHTLIILNQTEYIECKWKNIFFERTENDSFNKKYFKSQEFCTVKKIQATFMDILLLFHYTKIVTND